MPGESRPRKSVISGLVGWFGFSNAELLRAMPAGVMGAVAGLYASAHLPLPGWVGPGLHLAILLGGAGTGFAIGLLVVRLVVHGSSTLVARSVMPSGATTPSRADYSREDALVMQRDVLGALDSYEARLAADPFLVAARLRAADLYAREGNDPGRAAVLFRDVQCIPGVAPADDLYASHRLVDLYDGPLGNTGRAIVELRRIVDRYAGTRAAEEAQRGMATLKARHLDSVPSRADHPPD